MVATRMPDNPGFSRSFVQTLCSDKTLTVGFLGFGEVGQALAAELIAAKNRAGIGRINLTAFDLFFADQGSRPSLAASSQGVQIATDPVALAVNSDIVLSAVTAANDQIAAQSVAPGINGTWYLDLNSASPGMKESASVAVENGGGCYIEAAVMSPIEPRRLASPMLLGGPRAAEFLNLAQSLGFKGMRVFSDRVGPASATKMCRSVVIKGMEALLMEALLPARRYGVESVVLDSLSDFFPIDDWPRLARYMISRSIEHGARRAEEMQEVAITVEQAGISPLMSTACVERQRWAPAYQHALGEPDLPAMLDAMLAQIQPQQANTPQEAPHDY